MGYFLLCTDNNQGQVAGDWVVIDWIRPLTDQFNIELEDPEQLDEIETMTRLIVAASQSDGPLVRDHIDRILGLDGP
jgi:predicted KAP-like P-loop ATPase